MDQSPPRIPADSQTSTSMGSTASQIPPPPPESVSGVDSRPQRDDPPTSHGYEYDYGNGNGPRVGGSSSVSFGDDWERGVRHSTDALQQRQPHHGYCAGNDVRAEYVYVGAEPGRSSYHFADRWGHQHPQQSGQRTSFAPDASAPPPPLGGGGGGPSSRRPTSSEINPRELLLSRSAQVQHYTPANRLSDLTRGVSWSGGGSGLPVVPPSAMELHAHIAASATAADTKSHVSSTVKLLKSKGKVPKGASRNSPASAGRLHRTSADQRDGSADLSTIRRIEIGNSKLLRQFEELDKEIRQMKAERAVGGNPQISTAAASSSGDKSSAAPVAHGRERGGGGGGGGRKEGARSSLFSTCIYICCKQCGYSCTGRVEPQQSTMKKLSSSSSSYWRASSEEVPPPPPSAQLQDSVGDQEALHAIKMIFHESVDKVSVCV
jgi:hypothetical protein